MGGKYRTYLTFTALKVRTAASVRICRFKLCRSPLWSIAAALFYQYLYSWTRAILRGNKRFYTRHSCLEWQSGYTCKDTIRSGHTKPINTPSGARQISNLLINVQFERWVVLVTTYCLESWYSGIHKNIQIWNPPHTAQKYSRSFIRVWTISTMYFHHPVLHTYVLGIGTYTITY